MVDRTLYPFESRYCDRGGLKMHYLDEGRGAPVVMVHGNPTWSFYYRGLALALRASHRVIVPDHIGMGLSDKPGGDRYDFRLKSRVDDLEALLEQLGVREDITLVVHDWGGMIGFAWACRHPERIKRLVVFNTAAFPPPAGKTLPWQLALSRTALGPLLIQGLNAFCRGAARSCVARRPMTAEIAAGYLAPYDTWGHRLAVLRFVQDIPLGPADPSDALVRETGEKLSVLAERPMLLAWGGRDFVFDGDYYREWRRRFPRAEAHLLSDAGHYVLEDAREELVPLVRDFLVRHPLAKHV